MLQYNKLPKTKAYFSENKKKLAFITITHKELFFRKNVINNKNNARKRSYLPIPKEDMFLSRNILLDSRHHNTLTFVFIEISLLKLLMFFSKNKNNLYPQLDDYIFSKLNDKPCLESNPFNKAYNYFFKTYALPNLSLNNNIILPIYDGFIPPYYKFLKIFTYNDI